MIAAELTNERRAGLLFDRLPKNAHAGILERITSLTRQLEARILGVIPTGKGKLASQVRAFVDDRQTKISGKVKVIAGNSKSDHGKAAALEYGAHGRFTVAAHQRTISTVFGRAVAPTVAFVEAYSRTANIAEHRFLRGPLAEMRAQIAAELNLALAQAEAAS